jgi:hypothetical protein
MRRTMSRVIVFVAAVLWSASSRAETWAPLEDYVKACPLIVKCTTEVKGDTVIYKVQEAWKGTCSPDLFRQPPPDGHLYTNTWHGNQNPTHGREVIFFFTAAPLSTNGKLTLHSTAFVVKDDKIVYAPTDEGGGLRRQYAVADFRREILRIAREQQDRINVVQTAKAMDTPAASPEPERKRREAQAAERAAAEKAEDEHYRALYANFKAQILHAVKAGNKDEVAKVTDKFNQSLRGRLLYVRVTRIDDYVRVATTDAPGKMTTLINKPFGDRQIALPNLHYAYSPKPHVTRQTDEGRTYILVETNRLEGGRYADDVFITMAIDTRDPGAWPKGPAAVRQVIALLEMPWQEKLSDGKLDKAAASIKPVADEAVDEIMRAFKRRGQTFAYRHRAVQILQRLRTEKARGTLLDIALGRSAEHLPSMKQWASAAYIRTMKDKAGARTLLASDDPGVLNNALLAIKGIEVDKALFERLLELIARKEKEPVSQRAIRHAAAAVMAADPGGKFIPQKVDAILAALADVANMPDASKVYWPGYYTHAEASYHHYLNCLCQMKGADAALRQATGRAAGVAREILVIARAQRGDATVRQDIHRILEDRQAGIRRAWAARGLAAIGTREDLPILKKVAASDPLEREQGGDVGPPDAKRTFFPVRGAAQDAVRQIESRLRATPKSELRGRPGAKGETRLGDRAAAASGDVEVRLRAEKEVRAPGEPPALMVDMHNKGKRERVFSFWECVNCRLEWDGPGTTSARTLQPATNCCA